jgi:hypothetical protein
LSGGRDALGSRAVAHLPATAAFHALEEYVDQFDYFQPGCFSSMSGGSRRRSALDIAHIPKEVAPFDGRHVEFQARHNFNAFTNEWEWDSGTC